MIRVLIWNEYHHEKTHENVAELYPDGIHGYIKNFLSSEEDFAVTTATLDMENCGLSDELLANTDVLIWWGHVKHNEVPDEWVKKIQARVQAGMGFIGLHSAHHSKIFKALMGTTCNLQWRESGDHERLWNIAPNHPVMKGLPEYFELDSEETYGERFDIPTPEDVLAIGWFSGGEVFRSVCTFTRGLGRILYLQPGHETVPTFHNPHIQRIITNGIRWAAPNCTVELNCPHAKVSPEEKYAAGQRPENEVR